MALSWENQSPGREWLKTAAFDKPLLDGFPILTTERTILREPRLSDWGSIKSIYITDRSRLFGGPFSEYDGWQDWAHMIAGWTLRGFGAWTLAHKDSDAVLGCVLLCHYAFDAELELGWFNTVDAEGKGYVTEAASAAFEWAFSDRQVPTLVSYMDPHNYRSIAVAERLGGVLDTTAWRQDDNDKVYRYINPNKRGLQ